MREISARAIPAADPGLPSRIGRSADNHLDPKADDMNSVLIRRLVGGVLAVLLGLSSSLLAIQPQAAHADGTVGIAISPATAKGRDDRTRFSYAVNPGQQVTDHVLVSNVGSTKLAIKVFATDAYNTDDGGYALLDSNAQAKDVGSWVRFSGGKKMLTLNLGPGKSEIVRFTVTVPADARPGDHPGGVVAAATSVGEQVNVERRIANRLYARVAGDLQPHLTISSFVADYQSSLNPLDGTVTITAVLENTGNVALGGTVSLSTTSWFGASIGPKVDRELSEMLPGATRTVSYQLPGVAAVGYLVPHLQLRSSVTGDAQNPGTLPVVDRDGFLLAIPWVVVAVLALGVIAVFGMRWRRAVNARRAAEWVAYTKAQAAEKAKGGATDAESEQDEGTG